MLLVRHGAVELVEYDEDRGKISSLLERHRNNAPKRVVHQLFLPTVEVLVMPKIRDKPH